MNVIGIIVMKFIKLSSFLILSLFFLVAFVPQAEAKHYNKHHHHRTQTSFGLHFNVASPRPAYVAYPAPSPMIVMPYGYVAPVYYAAPYPQQQVIIQNPRPSGFTFAPQISFWRY